MNTLIVFAHPNPKSFNGRLKDTAVETLESMGHAVQVSDLFAMNFKCTADQEDFTTLANPNYFDLQFEQREAMIAGTFTDDIKEEQEKLRWAELLIFQFPFWWFSMPAPLKGYFDRVFSVGFAYSGASELAGKKAIICTTTGSPNERWVESNQAGTIEYIFHHIHFGVFEFCGMETLKPFAIGPAKRLTEDQKQEKIEEWGNILRDIESRKRLFL
jgi:NAD(P)H dehydrogenase (quinone)